MYVKSLTKGTLIQHFSKRMLFVSHMRIEVLRMEVLRKVQRIISHFSDERLDPEISSAVTLRS